MKSFKNVTSIKRFPVSRIIQTPSFITNPSININSFTYYNSLTQIQKDSLLWLGGGNNVNTGGPVIVYGTSVWGFKTPFPSGTQCVGIQANSFIERSIFLVAKTYTLSFSYNTRSGSSANSVILLIDNVSIGSLPTVSSSVWKVFSLPFTVTVDKLVVVRFLGGTTIDATTGINDITIT